MREDQADPWGAGHPLWLGMAKGFMSKASSKVAVAASSSLVRRVLRWPAACRVWVRPWWQDATGHLTGTLGGQKLP